MSCDFLNRCCFLKNTRPNERIHYGFIEQIELVTYQISGARGRTDYMNVYSKNKIDIPKAKLCSVYISLRANLYSFAEWQNGMHFKLLLESF